jgi:hypothetical protein
MKPLTLIGVVFLVLGILALIYQGISFTTSESVVDIGPLEIREEDTDTIPLPPIIGVIGIAAGAFLLYAGAKK